MQYNLAPEEVPENVSFTLISLLLFSKGAKIPSSLGFNWEVLSPAVPDLSVPWVRK